MNFFILLLALHQFRWGLKALDSSSITFEYDVMDASHTILNAEIITKPGCLKKCGNLTVPYLFGILSEGLSCSRDYWFDITCNNSTNPPKAFFSTSNQEVFDISNSELRISNFLAYYCYSTSGKVTKGQRMEFNLLGTSLTYSKANVLTVVGCDDFGFISNAVEGSTAQGCINTCQNSSIIKAVECSGGGCCQLSINIQQYYALDLVSINNHTNVSYFSSCGYAFFGEESRFKYKGISDLKDPGFLNRTTTSVPIVLDWAIGNKSCTEAYQDSNSLACKDPNSYCIDGNQSVGYRCSCKHGYEGSSLHSAALFPLPAGLGRKCGVAAVGTLQNNA